MKKILMLAVCAALYACGANDGPKPEEVAMQAAKAYYDQLINGDYNAFAEGAMHGDSLLPEDYRNQICLNMEMYMERQREAHGGLKDVKTASATCDTAHHTAIAYLTLCYADSTRERIAVPMLEKKGIWYLR